MNSRESRLRLVSRYEGEAHIKFYFNGRALWLYAGRSFNLRRGVQRQRVSRHSGYVQIAYGRVRHFGKPARRTLGLQLHGA